MLISLAAAFVLPLFSCSDASNDVGAGMVSFYVDKALMQKAVELSDKVSKNPNDEPQDEGERKLRFEVALEGEYKATKTVYASFKEEPYTEDPTGDEPRQDGPRYNFDSFSIDFAGIPVGKTVWAKIKVYEESEQERDEPVNERREPLLYGKSQIISVSSGTNLLSVGAYSYQTYVPYKFTIQFDQEPDFSTCSYNRICAVDPASKFVAKLRAAKDDVDRYEACNQFEEKYSEDCWLGEMDLNYDAELSYSADGKTVTADGDMRMYVSEDDPASRAATALFVLICQNYSGKTKYYGMASSAMAPMKKQENMASFSATALGVADTNFAMYKLESWNYSYYLTDDASASLIGDPNFESSGSSDTIDPPYSQSYCFDADGKFYTLSVTPDGGPVYIESNNSVVGTYECMDGSGSPMRFNSIACDLKKNELFLFKDRGDSIYVLYGTGNFLQSGTNAQVAYLLDISEIGIDFQSVNKGFFAVSGGTAYFAAQSLEGKPYLLKADLSKKRESTDPDYNYYVDLEIVAEIPLPNDVALGVSNAEFTDMLFQEGAVYLLFAESEDCINDKSYASGELYYKSRGALIKCDVSTKSVKTIGWTDGAMDVSNTGFYGYYLSGGSTYYDFHTVQDQTKQSKQTKWMISGNISCVWPDHDYTIKSKLPKIYSPSLGAASKAFYSPQKFIAVKPKQLVIADNGAAFYADTYKGGLRYKNAKRVVTVDLENFAISGYTDNNEAFSEVVNASIYTNTFGTIMTFSEYLAGSSVFIYNGSPFSESDSNGTAVYLGVPFGDE